MAAPVVLLQSLSYVFCEARDDLPRGCYPYIIVCLLELVSVTAILVCYYASLIVSRDSHLEELVHLVLRQRSWTAFKSGKGNSCAQLIKHHTMKTYGGVDV
jgi:hypothetical protein